MSEPKIDSRALFEEHMHNQEIKHLKDKCNRLTKELNRYRFKEGFALLDVDEEEKTT